MNHVSKVKIAAGYGLLLLLLLLALLLIRREVGVLMRSDERDRQWSDTLLTLLHQKDENLLRLLEDLDGLSGQLLPSGELERVLAEHDSVYVRQRVQQHVVTHHDTLKVPQQRKRFFRRLGEVFVPPKDTAIQVSTSQEFGTDTILEAYNPADSLQALLEEAARRQRRASLAVRRRQQAMQRMDTLLSARIDTLLQSREAEELLASRREMELEQGVRRRSAVIITAIAVGALLLAVAFLVLIGRDIARSNRYRRELEEARRRAEELLAIREKLMLAITHDFKAPLGSIMGYIDLLRRLTADERQQFYLDNMHASSEHLLELVTNLLDFHRLELRKVELHPVAFVPRRLLEEVRLAFEPLAAARGLTLEVCTQLSVDEAFVSDPLRLRQVVNNLLYNAVKFTERGKITLTAGYEPSSEKNGSRNAAPSGNVPSDTGHLLIAVADTGPGIRPADRERIFREFTRLPEAQGKQGFGLGLSIVRLLVQLLEGDIDLQSEWGKGSTFTVRVPVRRAEVAPDGKPDEASGLPKPAAEPPLPLKRILLIDDDRIQLELTAAMLSRQGVECVCCLQVDELLEALRTSTFDLLLTDLQMPAISGFDLLRLLRASNIGQARTLPVVAVTARDDMSPSDFLEQGFAGLLRKPFSSADLFAVLAGQPVTEAQPPATEKASRPLSPDSPASSSSYDFSALTAFSADDEAAARDILTSFREETRRHRLRLAEASDAGRWDEVAALAHKMIPLFTLIHADAPAALLRRLERNGKEADEGTLQTLLPMIDEVVEAVGNI